MVGPVAVVLACIVSAWMAVRSDDGVVAQDYYKRGLLINQTIKHAPPGPLPAAAVSIGVDARVHVRLSGTASPPARLQLTFARAGDRTHGQRIELAAAADEWIGDLPELNKGRWLVELESERWQLPVTIVDAPFTRLTLGSAF
jgi:hypothetical protein